MLNYDPDFEKKIDELNSGFVTTRGEDPKWTPYLRMQDIYRELTRAQIALRSHAGDASFMDPALTQTMLREDDGNYTYLNHWDRVHDPVYGKVSYVFMIKHKHSLTQQSTATWYYPLHREHFARDADVLDIGLPSFDERISLEVISPLGRHEVIIQDKEDPEAIVRDILLDSKHSLLGAGLLVNLVVDGEVRCSYFRSYNDRAPKPLDFPTRFHR